MNYITEINESTSYLNNKISNTPDVGIILGSGLGGLADLIEDPIIIPYENIPNFPVSTVKGHAGRLIIGKLSGKKIIAMQGRFHFYEGYPLTQVTFPIRVLADLGISRLIVTNAAGGVNKSFVPGDLMIIKDHINFTGSNPLIGPNLDLKGPRFLDMTEAYNKELIELARDVGKKCNISLKEGTYMWFTGPSYETPSEVNLASILGADAVGMSTVPEVIIANHESIDILGISCITNMAAGILDQPLKHDEVVQTSLKASDKFERLIIEIIKLI